MSTDEPGTRWVIVDDNDPGFHFVGDWFVDENNFAEYGVYGPTYLGSQHGTNTTGSVSFPFSGSQIRVFGTSVARNTSGVFDPTWTCEIDGVSYTPKDPWQWPINNWALCSVNLPANATGQHTINIDVQSSGETFWVDSIEYHPYPSARPQLNGSIVIINEYDPAVKYLKGGWQPYDNSTMLTLEVGSTVEVSFEGTGVEWMGWTPEGFPNGPSTATYSIDGGPPVSFDLAGLPPNGNGTLYQVQNFIVPNLSQGSHQLTVVHQGPSTPLVLDYLRITDGDILYPTTAAVVRPGNQTQETAPGKDDFPLPSGSSASKKAPVGAIVGGVIGAIAIIGIIALLVFFFVIKPRKRAAARVEAQQFNPASLQVTGNTMTTNHSQPVTYESAPLLYPNPLSSFPQSQQAGAAYPYLAEPSDSATTNHTGGSSSTGLPQPSPTNSFTPLRRGMVSPSPNANELYSAMVQPQFPNLSNLANRADGFKNTGYGGPNS